MLQGRKIAFYYYNNMTGKGKPTQNRRRMKDETEYLGTILSQLPELHWLIGLFLRQHRIFTFDTPL